MSVGSAASSRQPYFGTGKNQTEENSNQVEDTRHHRDRGGAGDQRLRLRSGQVSSSLSVAG